MEQLRVKLEQIAKKHFKKGSFHGLNRENIQPKKLKNVIDIHGIYNEKILFIYDDTLFGSAKEGMVFTDSGIYWREMMGEPKGLTYFEIVESTANINFSNGLIEVINKDDLFQLKDSYYKLICELRVELISSYAIYKTYYRDTLNFFERTLIDFAQNKDFNQIIKWITRYEGLFLTLEDYTTELREILFETYLNKKEFTKAEAELEILKDRNLSFYKKSITLLDKKMKEHEYDKLEVERLKAMANEDFEKAYILFEQQVSLNIGVKNHLQIELDMKEAQYKSLDKKRDQALMLGQYEVAKEILEEQKKLRVRTLGQIKNLENSMDKHRYNKLDEDRLRAIVNEEYHIAFFILEKQRELKVKTESEIEEIRNSMKRLKERVLKKYHEKLKVLVSHKSFLEADEMILRIHQIEPSFYLEREKILLMIYQSKLEEAKDLLSTLSNALLKIELETILSETTKKVNKKIRNSVLNKDYGYFKANPNMYSYKDEYGMSALDYFALEVDIEGIVMALEKARLPFIYKNIFGHSFLDLLCFACDPEIGNGKEDILEVLNAINQKLGLVEIDIRINKLSHKLSIGTDIQINKEEQVKMQKEKLKTFNQKIMSKTYFNQIIQKIKGGEGKEDEDIHDFMYQMFLKELEDGSDFLRKDEFETTKKYKQRCQEYAKKENNSILLEQYKVKNQYMFEELEKVLKRKNIKLIPEILGIIEYEDSGIWALERTKTDEGFLELINLYFPFKPPLVKIGDYNADKCMFYLTADGRLKELMVPLSIAKEFRRAFYTLNMSCHRILNKDFILDACIYEFNSQKIYFINQTRKISN